MSFNLKTKFPFIIALVAALIALLIYAVSGQSSFDQKFRELKNSDQNIEQVTVETGDDGQKNLEVKCQDGSSYEIYYPPGEGNYESLGSSKC